MLVAYTDGGCRGNPGPGGWGFLLVHSSGATLEKRGGDSQTTNNRMEMTAAIAVLESLTRPTEVEIRTDSKLLIDICSSWMKGWKKRGWKRKGNAPIKNLDLVKRLDTLVATHRVRWTWVKGHAGEAGNEHVDQLANAAMDAIAAGQDPSWEARHSEPPVRVPLRL